MSTFYNKVEHNEGSVNLLYQGTNPSALKSRAMIVTAMFELLETTPYTNINVRKLTDAAKVSRQTFYAMFDNREEVVQCRIEELFVDYQDALKREPLSLHTLVTLFFEFYENNADIFNPLLTNQLEPLLTSNASRCIRTLDLTPDATVKYTSEFIAAGLTQLLSSWYRTQDIPLTTLVEITEQLLNKNVIQTD